MSTAHRETLDGAIGAVALLKAFVPPIRSTPSQINIRYLHDDDHATNGGRVCHWHSV